MKNFDKKLEDAAHFLSCLQWSEPFEDAEECSAAVARRVEARNKLEHLFRAASGCSLAALDALAFLVGAGLDTGRRDPVFARAQARWEELAKQRDEEELRESKAGPAQIDALLVENVRLSKQIAYLEDVLALERSERTVGRRRLCRHGYSRCMICEYDERYHAKTVPEGAPPISDLGPQIEDIFVRHTDGQTTEKMRAELRALLRAKR